ncbi:MAG: sugar phosphate isomerase/epimerase family protein [Bryobacteraceae bacterium]
MPTLRRRTFLACAGAMAVAHAADAPSPRPGCQTNAWNLDPARFDLLLTALREMKELEFQGFETNIRFVQPQLEHAAEARARLEAFGLEFIAAHTNLPEYVIAGPESAAAAVTKLAAEAKQFGARALVVSHAGLSPTGEFSEQALAAKVRALELAGRRAADAGLVLVYHNHQPEFRNQAAEESALVQRTDPKLVSLMFDIGHAWLAYPDAVAFFEAHHARVYGLHVRDFHNRVSVPLGEGEFPLRKLADAIRKTGWHGWLIDEEERPDEPDKPGKRATGPSRRTMKAVFGV